MDKPQRILMGVVLFVPLVVFLSWSLWASYNTDGSTASIREQLLTPHDDLLAVHFRGDHGWAVGMHGLILNTEDGGLTWQQQQSGTKKGLTSVSFANGRYGFVVGSGGTVLSTSDSGITWNTGNSGNAEHLLDVHAVTPTRVYAVGAFGVVLSSRDEGKNWRKHALPWEKLIPRVIQESSYLEPNLNAVHFVTPEIGWIAGEFGLVLNTRDDWKSWISQRHGYDLPQLFDVFFIDERNGWAVGQRGTLIETRDGGRSWAILETGTTQNLYGIFFDGTRGMIVGEGIVLTKADGEARWAHVDSLPQNIWFNDVAISMNNAFIVGKAGWLHSLPFGGRKGTRSQSEGSVP